MFELRNPAACADIPHKNVRNIDTSNIIGLLVGQVVFTTDLMVWKSLMLHRQTSTE